MEKNMMTMDIKDYVEDLIRSNKDINIFTLDNFIYFAKANDILVSNKGNEYFFEIANNERKAGFSFINEPGNNSYNKLIDVFKKFENSVSTEYFIGTIASKESRTTPVIENFPLYMQKLEIDSREIFCKWKSFIGQVQSYTLFLNDVAAGKIEIDAKPEVDFEMVD